MPRLSSASWLLPFALSAAACCGEGKQQTIATSPHYNGEAETDTQAGAHSEVLHGEASYYADFFDGRKTASGERYDPRKLTAANRTLPLGTRVRIRRVDTGQSVVVRVNDRGPFGKRRRIFDLSKAAARQLDMLHSGKAQVEAVVLD
jgi:rare lipoprotein A